MKKRTLLWVVVLVMSISVVTVFSFVGCKKEITPAEEAVPAKEEAAEEAPAKEETVPAEEAVPQKITIITTADDRPVIEAAAEKFLDQRGVEVEIVSQSYDTTHEKIVSSQAGGSTAFDLCYVDVVWPAEFAEAGFIIPLDDRLDDATRNELVPVTVNQLMYKDSLWAMPFANEGKFFYYNESLLKEAGYDEPPETWSDLIDMSKDMIDKGLVKYGISFGWGQHEGLICDWTIYLYDFGGQWKDQSGEWAFNQEGGADALQFMVDSLYTNKIADPASLEQNDRDVLNPFMAGDTPFVINWSFAWSLVNDPEVSQVVDQVKIGLIPGVKEAGTISSSVTGGGGYAILANSQNPDLAWEFLEFMTNKENQKMMTQLTSKMPVWKSLYDDPDILDEFPFFSSFFKQFEYANFRPAFPEYSEFSNLVQVEIHNALAGNKTPQEALDDAVEAVSQRFGG